MGQPHSKLFSSFVLNFYRVCHNTEMVLLIWSSCHYPFAMASMQEGSLGFSGAAACFLSYGDSSFQSLFKSIEQVKSRLGRASFLQRLVVGFTEWAQLEEEAALVPQVIHSYRIWCKRWCVKQFVFRPGSDRVHKCPLNLFSPCLGLYQTYFTLLWYAGGISYVER